MVRAWGPGGVKLLLASPPQSRRQLQFRVALRRSAFNQDPVPEASTGIHFESFR